MNIHRAPYLQTPQKTSIFEDPKRIFSLFWQNVRFFFLLHVVCASYMIAFVRVDMPEWNNWAKKTKSNNEEKERNKERKKGKHKGKTQFAKELIAQRDHGTGRAKHHHFEFRGHHGFLQHPPQLCELTLHGMNDHNLANLISNTQTVNKNRKKSKSRGKGKGELTWFFQNLLLIS